MNTTTTTESKICAFCGKPAEGNYDIHRDDMGVGPIVPLCDACGGGSEPDCPEIWMKISQEGQWAECRTES